MPTRRKFLVGLCGGSIATALTVGSGAFSTVNADRAVSIEVASDANAYLRLTQRGAGRRSYIDGNGDTLGFDIPGPDEDEYGGTNPQGVGTDSVYRFGEDAASDEKGLFGVENQGTQPVEIYSTQSDTSGVPSVTIFDVETGERLTENSRSDPLSVGDKLLCGLEIDTHGVDVRDEEYEVTLTINAEAPD